MSETLRIISLHAENVKRIKAIDITPDPSEPVVQITGKNANGKTSVLDSIVYALGGERAIPSEPIRKGEKSAEIVLDLGELKVTRSFTPNKSYLTVESATGTLKSPQQVLSKLYGDLTFDPLEFMRMKPTEQRDRLLALCPEVDLKGIDAKRKDAYDERTVANREVKRIEGVLSGFSDLKDKPERISVTEQVEERKRREVEIARIDEGTTKAYDLENKLAQTHKRIEVLCNESQLEMKKLEGECDELSTMIFDIRTELQGKKVPTLTDIDEQLASADEVNAIVARFDERDKVADELQETIGLAEIYQDAIENYDKAKEIALATANLPVEGLGLEGEGVTFKGLPLDQASSAEQLKVSLGLAMAANPKLRIIRITDGSLLDSESLGIVREMAAEKGFQVWVEVCDETGNIGVYIEDGEVACVNGEPVL